TYLIKKLSNVNEISHRLSWADTDNRHIIPLNRKDFIKSIMIGGECNGCSVGQYTA
ncbi:MAG: hypothetical protein ACI8T6_001316, partial [Candidatus Poseidoniaceae archaeon]